MTSLSSYVLPIIRELEDEMYVFSLFFSVIFIYSPHIYVFV